MAVCDSNIALRHPTWSSNFNRIRRLIQKSSKIDDASASDRQHSGWMSRTRTWTEICDCRFSTGITIENIVEHVGLPTLLPKTSADGQSRSLFAKVDHEMASAPGSGSGSGSSKCKAAQILSCGVQQNCWAQRNRYVPSPRGIAKCRVCDVAQVTCRPWSSYISDTCSGA